MPSCPAFPRQHDFYHTTKDVYVSSVFFYAIEKLKSCSPVVGVWFCRYMNVAPPESLQEAQVLQYGLSSIPRNVDQGFSNSI
jgi:hypothetical protein